MARRPPNRTRTATHRPAKRRRRSRHDEITGIDLFGGFGGLTQSILDAGVTAIAAANHNEYKVEVHEANHPEVEHWIADLVDTEAADYHDARDLPRADVLVGGVSCVNHSLANSQKAYARGLTLFDYDDPEWEARVTRSEKDRATANCMLHYAQVHHPRVILVECTGGLTSWGPARLDNPKVGDGSTYRWWRKQFDLLEYDSQVLYLNAQFFGVGQSRDRLFIAFWKKYLPKPDLEHRPLSWCGSCEEMVEAVWTWRTGVPPSGIVMYGKQYHYTCPRDRRHVVIPTMTPSVDILDLSRLGTRIGDKPIKTHRDGSVGPLAATTMARAERCRQRFADFPAVLMPAKAVRGSERHPWQPMNTQTSQQEVGLLSTGAIMGAAGHTFERPGSDCRSRDLSQPIWAQTATNTTGLVTPPVALAGQVLAAHRHNGDGKPLSRPMDTITTTHEKAMLVAAVDNWQGVPRGLGTPLPTQTASETMGLVSAGIVPFRKNTVPTPAAAPMPTMTAEQIPGLLSAAGMAALDAEGLLPADWTAQWRDVLSKVTLEECFFRMLFDYEIGAACGFDTTYPGGREGTFKVWGSSRDQVDGFGNAVPPPMGAWVASRLVRILHSPEV